MNSLHTKNKNYTRWIKWLMMLSFVFITQIITAQNTQLKLWSLPDKYIDFSTTPPTVNNLPQGNLYSGQTAEYTHNIMYDKDGNLLFFIVDEWVYDGNGDFLGLLEGPNGHHKGNSEHLVVPVPGDCNNKFYIITPTGQSVIAGYFTLDLLNVGTLPYTELNLGPPPSSFTKGLLGISLSMSTINSDNTRFLYITSLNHLAIIKFIVTTTGITPAGTIPLKNGVIDRFSRTEMELIKLNGTYKLAVSVLNLNTNQISIVVFTLDNDGITVLDEKYIDINPFSFTYEIKGLEFSPEGTYLYFSTNQSDPLRYVDLSSASPTAFYLSNATTIPNPADFADTQIEFGRDEHLYFAANDRLAYLTNAKNPASTWVDNAISVNIPKSFGMYYPSNPICGNACCPCLGIRILPDQIDGEDYDNTRPYYINTYTATTSATWTPFSNPFGNSATVVINELLTIPADISIVIEGMTFKFGENAEVILERGSPGTKGAELTLDNTVFSSFDNCGELELMWKGIQVWGYPDESQSEVNTQQGHLIIRNNSLIENAKLGITAYDPNNTSGNRGGIIQAENSTFRNNETSAKLLFYFNFIPSPPYTNISNLSYFSNCTFETTQQYFSMNQPIHVYMFEVHGINFRGNTFRNTTTNPFTQTDAQNRGIGIYSLDASYTVEPLGVTSNTFQELNYGIQAYNFNPLYTLTVDGNEFINNRSGVSLNGVYYATITSNDFVIGQYDFIPFNFYTLPHGLYLNGCTGYQVENNEFSISLPYNFNSIPLGSIALSSGALPNLIYNNEYHNLFVNCLAEGNNSGVNPGDGLQIKCNRFDNLRITAPGQGFDIAVTYLTTFGPGIAEFQGTCIDATTPAGNRFYYSACPTNDDANIFQGSNAQPIVYSHHTNAVAFPQKPECYTEPPADQAITLNPCPFSLTGACPPTSECITESDFTTCYIGLDDAEKMAVDLNNLIDGGNTQFLLGKIKQGNPGQILNALMDASPYLSDEVLLAAINAKPPLPPGILQQILIANSPLTDSVMDALNNIFVPNGVRNQINNVQTGISDRTKLESEIAYYLSKRELIINDIIRFYLNSDSLSAMDSVIAILKRENRPMRREQLVAAFVKEEEFTEAEQEITQLHPNGNLCNFCKVQSVLIELGKQGKNIKQIDSLQEQTIRAVAADTAQKACANAQAILKAAFEENFREIIVLPAKNQNKMAPKQDEDKTAWLNENHNLLNFPNPFSEFTSVEAYVPDNINNAEIVIYDILGTEIKKFVLETGYNIVTVLPDDLPKDGLYLYALKANERILAKRKMMIIR